MKLLLILPTQLDHDGKPIRRKKASVNLNLNLPLLAGLAPPDVEARIINDYLEDIAPDLPVDLVGITTLLTSATRAYQLGDAFRARGKKVVMGGFHATACPDEVRPHCDALVFGEAEETWPRIIEDFRRGRLQDTYRATSQPELKGLPVPRYELVDKRKYMVEVYPVETSRGCPHACDYCASTKFHGHRHRLRPIGEVMRDIRATKSRYIAFIDDNIIGHKEHARELFKALIPLDIRWMAQTTMYMADDMELLDTAVKSGMRFAWTGIESLSQANLDEVHRNINQIDEFERRIKAFQKHGVIVGTNMMFGFDNETEEQFDQAYRFLARNRVFPFLYILTPIPGTALYDRLEREKRILHKNWTRYTSFECVIQPKNFSPEKLNDLYFGLARRIFSTKNNIRRSLPGMFHNGFSRKFPFVRWNNLVESFFIRLAGFVVYSSVSHAAKIRYPTYW